MLDQTALIGIIIGSIIAAIIILIIIICIVCNKCEKCCLKISLKRDARKYEERRTTLTESQIERKQKMNERHDEIRKKYGIQKKEAIINDVDETAANKY